MQKNNSEKYYFPCTHCDEIERGQIECNQYLFGYCQMLKTAGYICEFDDKREISEVSEKFDKKYVQFFGSDF